MSTCRALLPVALALALSVCPRVCGGAGFNDGDFTTYPWTAVKIQDTTALQNAGFSAGEMLTGGIGGGAYRSNSFSFSFNGSPTNQGIIIGNLSSNIMYNPAISGAINSITSFGIAANYSPSTGAPAVYVGLLLLQGGAYYTNHFQPIGGFGIPIKESSPQLATDFTRVGSSGPANPDFTTNGGPIEFGYITAASLASGASATIAGTFGVDQFALTIANTPVMPRFTSQQAANATNLLVTLSGLAPGESITWLVSTNLVDWPTNNPAGSATGTNGTFTVTNSVYPAAQDWFLRALVW